MIKLRFITNKEYVRRHKPAAISDRWGGGACGCPEDYGLQEQTINAECHNTTCEECWNKLAIKKSRYILTRKKGGVKNEK